MKKLFCNPNNRSNAFLLRWGACFSLQQKYFICGSIYECTSKFVGKRKEKISLVQNILKPTRSFFIVCIFHELYADPLICIDFNIFTPRYMCLFLQFPHALFQVPLSVYRELTNRNNLHCGSLVLLVCPAHCPGISGGKHSPWMLHWRLFYPYTSRHAPLSPAHTFHCWQCGGWDALESSNPVSYRASHGLSICW